MNSSNGFQTNIWGPCAWLFLHCISLNYNPQFKKEYYMFFKYIQYILPCKTCRDNYAQYIKKRLRVHHFKDRRSLAKWVFNLHNYILKKTGKSLLYPNNEDGFFQMVAFYEQFRAKCNYNKVNNTEVGCTKSMYPGMRLRSTIQIRPMIQLKKAISMKKCNQSYNCQR